MNQETEDKLARSLTVRNKDVLPYVPYLLQDLWELGTPANDIIDIIRQHIPQPENLKVLDLACGKGAIAIPLAHELGMAVKGVDIIPEFIEFAKEKAIERGVDDLCTFSVEDIKETAAREQDYDMVLFLGVGDVFGNAEKTMETLAGFVRPGGYVVLEEAYVGDNNKEDLHFETDYPSYEEWINANEKAGLRLLAKKEEDEEDMIESNSGCNDAINRRARELSEKYPDKKALFDEYIQSQLDECYDLENNLSAAVWLLQRTEQ